MSFFKKKSPAEKSEIVAALDLGTSKICSAIAKVNEQATSDATSSLRIVGLGHQVSKGLKGSNIVDLDALEDSILNAVHSSEQQAQRNISGVYVNIPAGATLSQTVRNEMYLSGATVDESHLRKLLTLGRDSVIAADRHIIHILPISYELDGVRGIRDPKGMVGDKLSVFLHIVSAPVGFVRNVMACIGRCHLDVKGFVASAYASGLATLVDDEMELGVTVIDMGGGHTSMASFYEGALLNVSTINIGGNIVTQDIARGLATPLSQAERLKTLYGSVLPPSADDREPIMITQMGESHSNFSNQISKKTLTHIIRARVEETFELVLRKMKTSDVDPIVYQRIVLTGGASQMQGIRDLALQIFGRPVRVAHPSGLTGMGDLITSPAFATCAGLLRYSIQDLKGDKGILPQSKIGGWNRLNSWFKQNF
jgi:cell division protein FtsA